MAHINHQKVWAFLAGVGLAGAAYVSTRVSFTDSSQSKLTFANSLVTHWALRDLILTECRH